jgi:hypothetical protein
VDAWHLKPRASRIEKGQSWKTESEANRGMEIREKKSCRGDWKTIIWLSSCLLIVFQSPRHGNQGEEVLQRRLEDNQKAGRKPDVTSEASEGVLQGWIG